MITSQNKDNKKKYEALFQKANQALGLSEENGIKNLNQYFGKIHDLHLQDRPTFSFLLVPADEAPLEIRANSREIVLPDVVKKYGAGIQGDQLAETLVFTIDRYFDFMDLFATNIYVQWVLPNGEHGSSEVKLKDIETEPGKIIFGWTLTEAITKAHGKIQFSVRFFKKNGEGKIEYSFNTLPQAIILHQALDVNIPNEVDNPADLFKTAITNSEYTAEGTAPADIPSFAEANFGKDLETKAYLKDDSLKLVAIATVQDTGYVSYEWVHTKKDGTSTVYKDNIIDFIKVDKADIVNNPRVTYYTKNDSVSPTSYDIYTGALIPEDITVELYRRYTSLEITASEEESVTGTYKVRATNTLGPNTSWTTDSTGCTVPAPGYLTFKTDLEKSAIIEGEDKKAKIAVQTDYDEKAETKISYIWKKRDDNGIEVVKGETDSTLETNIPGWYSVEVTSELNNDTLTITSEESKVTYLPVAPTVTNSPETAIDAKVGEQHVLTVETTQPTSLLESEGYEYKWYHQLTDVTSDESDLVPVELKDEDIDLVAGNSLTVHLLKDLQAQHYVCVVTNKLNGQIAETRSNTFSLI